MKKLKEFCGQFLGFGAVGIANTAIFLAVYYSFITLDKNLYIEGNIAGFIMGTLNSYYWNRQYIFKMASGGHIKTILKSFAAYGATLVLGIGLLIFWIDKLGISERTAPILNLIIIVPINFFSHRFWVMK